MKAVRQFLVLLRIRILSNRDMIPLVAMIQVALSLGLILGFGYFIPHIGKIQALYLTVGAATQTFVTVGLIMLPQLMSQEKAEGIHDYYLALPIGREAFLLSVVTFVGLVTLPATVATVLFGAWHYHLSLSVDPMVVVVALLAVFSLAGVGVGMAVLSPWQQLTNMMTQMVTFWVLLFSPVLMPRQQLPAALRHISDFLPTTYAGDAMRATLTDLPGSHFPRALAVLAAYSLASFVVCAYMMRRRG